MRYVISGSLILLVICASWLHPAKQEIPKMKVKSITTLRALGGQVDWCIANNTIAYDAAGADKFYDLYLMDPNGNNSRCLTCDHPKLPNKHIGSPTWHPGGKYIVFIAEKADHPGISYEALPGFGQHCDLWVINVETNEVTKLTDLPALKGQGVLMPHFSHDGKMLSWGQVKKEPKLFDPQSKQTVGYWSLFTADFVTDQATPALKNVKEYEPVKDVFYENNGFTPDGSSLYFAGNPDKQSVWKDQIYTLNLATNKITPLTNNNEYNEHPVFSPDGRLILWMTNLEAGKKSGTEWWLMNADGSLPYRLTWFNKKGHAHYKGKVWATDASWGPGGKTFVGYIQDNLIKQTGEIVRVDLE